jgi:hypothetical protein
LHAQITTLFNERTIRFNDEFKAIRDLLSEMDRRYEQRFIAQQEAIQAALLAQKEAVNAALTAADRALSKAELASEKRFEGVNEFRAALSDQARELMPRGEAQTLISSLSAKVNDLTDRFNRSEGKGTGKDQSWAVVIAVISALLGIGGLTLALMRG